MERKHIFLIILLLVFVSLLPSLFGEFVWDDEEQIINNTLIHSLRNIPTFFAGGTFNTGGSNELGGMYYKPLLTLTYSIIYTIFNLNPFFYHLVQFFLHILNSFIVFSVINTLLSKHSKISKKNIKVLSLFSSLIFAIHPINVEAVVYIAAFQDVLFFFFGISALCLLIEEKDFITIKFAETHFKIKSSMLVPMLLLLSILSKETGILFFALLILYSLIFARSKHKKYEILSSVMIVGILYVILRFGLANISITGWEFSPIMSASTFERFITMPKVFWFYLHTFFFPKDLLIAQYWVVREINITNFWIPFIAIVAFTSFCAFYVARTKSKIFLFFFGWYLIGMSIHSQLFPLDMTVADRWFYFPIVGMLGMLSIWISKLNTKKTALTIIPAFIIILALSARSFTRSLNWKNGLTLYSHDIKKNNKSFNLENNYGVELYRVGKLDEAIIHYEKSINLAPNWWTNWNNAGVAYQAKGDFNKAQEYYKKSINNGTYHLAFQNYTGLLLKQKKYKEALDFLEKKALVIYPYNKKLQKYYLYLKSQEKY